MTYIDTIPEDEASGPVAEMYAADRAQLGHVRNLTKALSVAPEVSAAWVQLNTSIKERMDLRRYELATVAAARRLRSTYCMHAHGSVLLDQFLDATWWYETDEEIELTPHIATQVMIDMSDPRSQHFGQMRHETLPADHIFGRRVEMLTLAVLGQLHARANWHRIAREWMYGDPPVTELGRQEAAFYGR